MHADILVHVIDASAGNRDRRAGAVRAVLAEVGAADVPVLDVFNKCDRLDAAEIDRLKALYPAAVFISAREGTGRAELVEILASRLAMDTERLHLELDGRRDPDRRLIADLYRHAHVISHVTTDDRVSIEADVPRRLVEKFARVSTPA